MKANTSSIVRIGIVLIMSILLIGLVFFATYQWQNSKVTDLQNQVTQLKSQLATGQKRTPMMSVNDETTYLSNKGVAIKVYAPSKAAKLTNPLAIIGEVLGNWSFEASFPVILKDSSGKVLAQASAQLLGDWMTTEFVPFSLKFPYSTPASGNGSLVLQKR